MEEFLAGLLQLSTHRWFVAATNNYNYNYNNYSLRELLVYSVVNYAGWLWMHGITKSSNGNCSTEGSWWVG